MKKLKKIYENSINVVFASDNNYAPCTTVAIYTLIAHTSKENNYDIVIFESGISDENKQIIEDLAKEYDNISIRFYSTKKFFEDYDFFHYAYYTADTYSRLFIPNVMEDYDKAIYLDGDIIVLADVAELYNFDLGDAILGGGRNYGLISSYYHNAEIRNYYDKMFPIKDIRNSINGGVLVMNLEKLREIDLLKQGIGLLDKYKRLLCQDEDILNKVCTDRIKHIESAWNWRFATPQPLLYDHKLLWLTQEWSQGLYEQKIIHYICKTKPWDEANMYYGEVWWAWAKKTPIYQQLLKAYFDKHPEQLNA